MKSILRSYAKLTHALSAHPGRLHRALGVPQGQKIPDDKLEEALNSKDPHMRKMAQLAKTARGFKH